MNWRYMNDSGIVMNNERRTEIEKSTTLIEKTARIYIESTQHYSPQSYQNPKRSGLLMSTELGNGSEHYFELCVWDSPSTPYYFDCRQWRCSRTESKL